MTDLWIWLSIFAAAMQAVRTAAQKRLNERVSTLATTYVRSAMGLPVMAVYVALMVRWAEWPLPAPAGSFWLLALAGAVSQILATAMLMRLFRQRGFAVASLLTKADIVIIALVGAALFSERISPGGALALAIVVAGVVLLSLGQLQSRQLGLEAPPVRLQSRTALEALATAFLFALSFLFFREATLAIGGEGALWRGAWTVTLATAMQLVLLGAWLLWREPAAFAGLMGNKVLVSFIGVTSALGSIAWFTAFAMQNASYVRAVSQVEVVFTLAISWGYFGERLTRIEIGGIALTLAGVLLFRLAG
jgi:drug/metabolite transporter (DMT)-like permease